MQLLAASIVPLLLGPPLVWVLQRARWAAQAIDAFVLTSVAGLVLLSILPGAIAHAGLIAVVAAVLGAILPLLGGSVFAANPAARTITLAVGLVGLFVHASLDGVALAAHDHGQEEEMPLAFAVILHRLPVGLAIWWLVRPKLGLHIALAAVASIAIASVVGFFWAHEAHDWMHGTSLSAFQALVAGSLLHVAAGHSVAPEKPARKEAWQLASAVGGLIGIGIVIVITTAHPLPHAVDTCMSFQRTLLSLASVSAPPLLVAYCLSAVFRVCLPDRHGAWLRGNSALSQTFRGISAGASANTCACTLNPRYESLVRRGIPPSAAIAFLVATPVLGVASLLVSFPLLGMELTVVRISTGVFLAAVIGLILGKALSRGPGLAASVQPLPTWKPRLQEGFHYGFVDVPDRTLPWFVAGIVAAAMMEPMLDPAVLARLPSGLDIPLLALFGTPFFFSALGATPVAAVLLHKGVSLGAVIALFLTGPAANISTFALLRALHGRRVAIAFFFILVSAAMAIGYVVHIAFPGKTVSLHALTPSPVHNAALALLALIAVFSLLRQGAHGFVSQVVELRDHHHHDHEHRGPAPHGHEPQHHDHAHDHEHSCAHHPGHEHPGAHDHDHQHSCGHGHEHEHAGP